MDLRPGHDIGLLVGATALTRFLFRSHCLYDIDSVNFALALQRFDLSVHQPHPPGYFLYVLLGRLVNVMVQDDNTALVAISIGASCGAALMIYLLASCWFGAIAARFAGMIFLFSPLAWFHGTVALVYIVETFFSALLGYMCWQAWRGNAGCALLAALVLGVAAGFRASSLVVLGPLLVLSLRGVSRKTAMGALGVLGLTVLAWTIPMIRQSGGLAAFTLPLWTLWKLVPGRATVFNSSPATSLARLYTIAGIAGLCLGSAILLPLAGPKKKSDGRIAKFTWIWVTPALLLFTFVFLKFVNSGYLLVVVPPLCAWLGSAAAGWFTSSSFSIQTRILVLAGGSAINTGLFLSAPVYCSYAETRRFESELHSILEALPQIASPREALIVGFDSHFLGYRHAGYYLPDYLVVQFPEIPVGSGTGVFLMQSRDTRAVRTIPNRLYKSFVIFPLPSSSPGEYHDYIDGIRGRFPRGELKTILERGCRFDIGPVSALPLLFPSAAFEPSP